MRAGELILQSDLAKRGDKCTVWELIVRLEQDGWHGTVSAALAPAMPWNPQTMNHSWWEPLQSAVPTGEPSHQAGPDVAGLSAVPSAQ